MFTGLVTDIGTIQSICKKREGKTLKISTHYQTDDLELGESIACNGACLTVTAVGVGCFDADCSSETIRCTTFSNAKVGDKLHLERALRLGDRFGGHYVMGHIDSIGSIVEIKKEPNSPVVIIEAPIEEAPYIVVKGSIAINGVSLTVNEVDDCRHSVRFSVKIIPYTFEATCFHEYKTGDLVNLETDVIGKYISRQIHLSTLETAAKEDKVSLSKLKEFGFT